MLLLDMLILLPLAFAPLAWVSSRLNHRWPRFFALAGVICQGAALAVVASSVTSAGSVVRGAIFAGGSTIWMTVMDGLSLPFLVLAVAIGSLAVVASWNVTKAPGSHHALLLILQGALAAVFLADSLVLFYIAWESVLIPMFFLIGGWGSSNSRRAAMKFLLFTFAGGAVLLVGVIVAIIQTGSLLISEISAAGGVTTPVMVFWLLAAGFLVKLPVVPLHTWLPDAHTEAPTAGSIVLAGVLLKMGGYGLIRVAVPFAPEGFEGARVALAILGVVGIIWGAATALVQSDLKRLVAYSSVAHMGFVALAIAVGTAASVSAAVVTMVSHGIVAGLLFFLVGALYERAHTREISSFGGLGVVAPRWSVVFVIASLASAGLPGLSGFPGEYVTLIEGFRAFSWWIVPAGVGVVLAAAYNLRAIAGTVQGTRGSSSGILDLSTRETSVSVACVVAIVVLGVAPHIVSSTVVPVIISLFPGMNGGL